MTSVLCQSAAATGAAVATPVPVSFKEIRAAAQEVFLEVYTEVLLFGVLVVC